MKLWRLMILIMVAVLFATAQLSCLVTDQIDFEDEVNHPPTLLKYNPVEQLQTIEVDENNNVVFIMTIWDPDVIVGTDIRAKLFISSESFPEIPPRPCGTDAADDAATTEGLDEIYAESDNLFDVTCDVNPYYITFDSPPGTQISVRMEVSDLGYVGDVPEDNAYTVSHSWTFRVVEPQN